MPRSLLVAWDHRWHPNSGLPLLSSPSLPWPPSSASCALHTSKEVHLRLLVLDGQSLQALWILDSHSLNIAVQLLLCALLIVTLAADADTKSVWDALDALLPDLLVELGVEADILGALVISISLPVSLVAEAV